MERAVVYDAMASTAVEDLLDKIELEIAEREKGRYMTWRFSPGYGDLPIDCQGEFLEALDADRRVGVRLTPGMLLVPTKSVTAIIGLSDAPTEKKTGSCATCNMRETCAFRKTGERCGG